jgi:hypothetical protein
LHPDRHVGIEESDALAMAALLNYGAESAREKALRRMQADLLWLKGAGPDYAGLTEQFPGLIEQVRNLRQGAFAPFFQQPLVRALLVPLGGAGFLGLTGGTIEKAQQRLVQ